jgi:PAS domain S-box-containing protein
MTDGQDRSEQFRDVEAMLDAITDYKIIKLDVRGSVETWNRGAEAITGYRADEVVGQPVSIFYTEEDRSAGLLDQELRTARETGRFEYEGWRVRKGGERYWASVALAPIRDAAGNLTGYVKVASDITERRENEQRLRRQSEEILELSTPVIQVWDKVLALPIIGTLDSTRAARLTEGLLQRISESQCEVVILDVSGVPTFDTAIAQHLLRTVQAATLMGAESILSGVRPETAQSMVQLGVELGDLRTRNTFRDALKLALQIVWDRAVSAAAAEALLTPDGP